MLTRLIRDRDQDQDIKPKTKCIHLTLGFVRQFEHAIYMEPIHYAK